MLFTITTLYIYYITILFCCQEGVLKLNVVDSNEKGDKGEDEADNPSYHTISAPVTLINPRKSEVPNNAEDTDYQKEKYDSIHFHPFVLIFIAGLPHRTRLATSVTSNSGLPLLYIAARACWRHLAYLLPAM
jgi:hypothetical protein